jgi:hypothetical protein
VFQFIDLIHQSSDSHTHNIFSLVVQAAIQPAHGSHDKEFIGAFRAILDLQLDDQNYLYDIELDILESSSEFQTQCLSFQVDRPVRYAILFLILETEPGWKALVSSAKLFLHHQDTTTPMMQRWTPQASICHWINSSMLEAFHHFHPQRDPIEFHSFFNRPSSDETETETETETGAGAGARYQRGKNPDPLSHVSIATQLTLDRFDRLIDMSEHWNGKSRLKFVHPSHRRIPFDSIPLIGDGYLIHIQHILFLIVYVLL